MQVRYYIERNPSTLPAWYVLVERTRPSRRHKNRDKVFIIIAKDADTALERVKKNVRLDETVHAITVLPFTADHGTCLYETK